MNQVKVIKQKEQRYKNKPILISWVLFPFTQTYEVMALSVQTGESIESYENVVNYADAEFYFNKFVKKYTDKKDIVKENKIPERYLRFADVYHKVYHLCKDFYASNPIKDDGGTSNLDCCLVYIGKRVQKGYLDAALKPYGLKASIHNKSVISVAVPYTNYQGFGNTEQVKYMCQKFQELGYESTIHYRAD